MSERQLKLGLPAGSMQEATIDLFRRAGFRISLPERSYVPAFDDPEITALLIRAQELPCYVEEGIFDAALTGYDWILERGVDVVEVAELAYARQGPGVARWVILVPEESEITAVEQLQGKRIATELVEVTRRYLAERGVQAEIEFSWGATEVKLRKIVDAVVDLTETGASIRANRLRVLDEVLQTTVRLIANRDSWADEWKRTKIENIAVMLQGALDAEGKVGLKMNVQRKDLDAVLALLPALKRPTISELAESGWVAVETIIDETVVRTIIPALKRAGASGIIEYPLNKVIP